MSEPIRTFVAVELPEPVQEALWVVQEELATLPALAGLRWVDPSDAHLTIKFLGDMPIPMLPAIVEALDGVAERWEPFTASLGGLGAFPSVYKPNVLWLGFADHISLFQRLYNNVEVALKPLGVKPERKEFHPHVTLARVPTNWTPAQRRAAGDLIGPTEIPPLPPVEVASLSLFRSLLTQEGPLYTRLGHARFGEAAPLQDDEWEDIPDDEWEDIPDEE